MSNYVRVQDNETGHQYSIPRERYEQVPHLWTLVERPATHVNGDPLPPKFKTTVSAEAEKKASRTAATTTEKEK